MLSVPHRAQDDKFTNSIEGYRGSIHKLGRLIAHDWFSVTLGDSTKERYLFLFKARLLISKVRRVSDERSVFQLKDIIRLEQVEIKDHPENDYLIELCDKVGGQSLLLTSHREKVKDVWLKELKNFASEATTEDSSSDDLQVIPNPASPPGEPVQKKQKVSRTVEATSITKAVQVVETCVSSSSDKGSVSATIVEIKQGVVDSKTGAISKTTVLNKHIVSDSASEKVEVVFKGGTNKSSAKVSIQEVEESNKSESNEQIVEVAEAQVAVAEVKKDSAVETKKVVEVSTAVQKGEVAQSLPQESKEVSIHIIEVPTKESKNSEVTKVQPEEVTVVETKVHEVASKTAESVVKVEASDKNEVTVLERPEYNTAQKVLETTAKVEACDRKETEPVKTPKKVIKEVKTTEKHIDIKSDTHTTEETKIVEEVKKEEKLNSDPKPSEVNCVEKSVESAIKLEVSKKQESSQASEKGKINSVSKTAEVKTVEKSIESTVKPEVDKNQESSESVEAPKKKADKVSLSKKVEKKTVEKSAESTKRVEVAEKKENKPVDDPKKVIEVSKPESQTSAIKNPDKSVEPTVKTEISQKKETKLVEELKKEVETVKPDIKNPEISSLEKPVESTLKVEVATKKESNSIKVQKKKTPIEKLETKSSQPKEEPIVFKPIEPVKKDPEPTTLKVEPIKKKTTADVSKKQNESNEDFINAKLSVKAGSCKSAQEAHNSEINSSGSKQGLCEKDIDAVAANVDLNIGEENTMSRKYQSTHGTTDAYGESSSYSRSAVRQSTYSSDSGLTSSKYGSEALTSSKYGGGKEASITTGKYGAEASITSKYGTESSAISGRYSTDALGGSKYDEVTSKYGRGLSTDGAGKYGVEASRYSTESSAAISGRYSTDALGGSKYDEVTSKYGRGLSTDGAASITGKYGVETSKYSTESSAISGRYSTDALGGSKYDEVTSKYGRGLSADGESSYSRRSLAIDTKGGAEDYTSKYSRGLSSDSDKYLGNGSSYSKRSVTMDARGGTESSITGSKYDEISTRYSRGLSSDSESGGSSYTRRSLALDSKTAAESKYDELSSKYSRNISVESDKYGERESSYKSKRRNLSLDSSETEPTSYSRKYVKTERRSLVDLDDNGTTYRRRGNRTHIDEEMDTGDDVYVSKRSSKSKISIEEDIDPDAYISKVKSRNGTDDHSTSSYKRRTNRTSIDEELDSGADVYVSKRSSKSQVSIEEDYDPEAYISKSKTRNDSENRSYRRTVSKEEDKEESYKRSTSQNEEDRLAKFEKYSRKSSDVSEHLETPSGNYKRTDSNSSTSHESIQTLAETTVISGEVQSQAVEEAQISATLSSKKNKLQEMAPPDDKPKRTKTQGGSQIKAEELELKKAGFIVKLNDAELQEDTYLRFMIKVKGDPHPTLTFFKDGVKISDKDTRVTVNRDHSDHDFYELVIPDVKAQDAGVYKCIAKNEHGEESTEATVTVTSSKHLFDDLVDQEGPLGAGEKPTFIWKRDGVEFEPEERFKVLMGDDEDSLALIFQHVKPEDAGMYTCVAQTSAGHISCSAELTVQGQVYELNREPEKPRLIIEKREALTTTGGSCMLELKCLGFPKPKVTWTHNGTPVEPGPKYKFLYEDDESISLVIKNVEGPDCGTYEITAENELGKDVKDMHLTVKAPPKLKSKMSDTSAATDQPLKMTLEVVGIPKPTVQFFKDGKPILPTEHIKVVEDGDKYNIVIDKTNLGDSGAYSVTLKNELAEVTESWDLSIYCAPKLLKGLGENKIVELKEQVELSIEIEAKPEAEITWYKDGQEIKSSEHLVVSKDGDTYKLKISGAVSTDSASYKVKAKNIHGSVESECRVDVRRKPTFTSELQNMTVTEGDKDVTFDLKLDAFPKPTIKWYLDEIELLESRSEFTRYETTDGAKLIIKEVNHTLSGQYTCKLLNDLGETSTSAKLTVHCKPRIIKQLKDTIVEEGATLHLEVEVDCCPEASEVKWLRNGKEVSADARITITRDKQRLENYHLTVNLVKYEEQGEYEVQITNAIGTVCSKSTVTVQKVMHSGAVEVTEAKKLIIEEVEDDSQQGKLAKKAVKIEVEVHEDSAQKTQVNDALQAEGTLYEKIQIVEVFTMEDIEGPQPIVEEESDKSKRGKSVMFVPSLDIVEMDKEQSLSPTDIDTPTPKSAKLAQKDTIEKVEGKNLSRQKSEVDNIKDDQPQKGKKSLEGEQDLEVVEPEKTTAQRGMVEDLSQEPEAIPKILDTNMKDGLQYESLDVSYLVKAWANPPPKATWTLNGNEIKPDSNARMTVGQSGEEFRLDIVKLDPKDAGLYECKLSNAVGDVRQQAKLEVIPEAELRRPKVKDGLGLKDQNVMKNKPATLTAVIVGDPIPNVAWLLNGKELTAEEIEKHGIYLEAKDVPIEHGLKETTFTLSIPRCEREIGGKYTIRAKNKWGVIESSGALNVLMAPEIDGPEYAKVISGEPAELICIVQSNPPATVTWSKCENPISSGGRIIISEDVPNETYKLRVVSAQIADEGYYKVFAKNEYGQTESEGKIRIINDGPSTEKPRFITGLQDSQVEHGREISLMIRADGVPKPDISWYHNDKLIENAQQMEYAHASDRQVACTYTISNWNPTDEGIYKVTATNEGGTVETSAKIAMVQSSPAFRLKLERSIELGEGEQLVIRASVTGSPKPTVSWVKDGKLLKPDDARIKMEHLPDGTVTLKIDEATPADSGSYKLIAKNHNGDTSGICAVAVTPKSQRPRFTKCIRDAKVKLGEPLRLSAKITGYPAPEVKWLKDGVPVRPSSSIHLEHQPDGSIALVVDSVRPENAGNYVLIVGNKHGDITGEAKVEVEKRQTKPEFIVKLYPQTVVEGFPARFEVKAVGFPQPIVSWYRNGVEVISDAKHIKMKDQPDGISYLVLDACDLARDGLNYEAIARNDAGEARTFAPLTVILATKKDEPEEAPMLLNGLRDVTTEEGSELKLEAPFTGNPIPSVQWAKDGVTIEPDERVLLTCDGKKIGLCIDHAISSDAGKYSVILTNTFGTDSSEANASVNKVYSPPAFIQRFTDLQQLSNRDAKIPVRVSGVPQPEVVWTKDGEVLSDSDKYRIKRDGDACCLYISDCGLEDEGVYKVTATNQEGEDFCQGRLEIVKEIKSSQRFEPASFIKRIGDTDLYKSMTARFTACAAGIPEPTVEWYLNDKRLYPSERIRMEKDLAGLLRLSVRGVDENDLGKYSCKIYNEHGSDICHAGLRFDDGVPHAKSKRETDDQLETGAPMALTDPPIISRMTDRHLTLSWKPSIPGGPRPPVTYILEMLEMPSGEWFTVRSGIRSCVCDVGNLEPFRDYKFRIRVENRHGISDPSPYALTHREKLLPDPPRFLPYLPPGIDFRPETSPYFPRDFDIDRPPHDNMSQAPLFLRQEHDAQYGVKDQGCNLCWFVYGYPKPSMQYYFNDELIESGGRFDFSYTRNGQATLFINKMLDRDVGWYEAIATNEHGTARQRVRLEIAEFPTFVKRPKIEYVMARNQARFEARILGVPYPEVKWYKDWKPLASSSRIKIQFIEPDQHILIINDSIYKDEGLYSVSARNVAGSISASAMLYVDENDLEYNLHTYRSFNPIRLKKKPLIDAYDLGDELGRGTQGVTYHCVERQNGSNYAAKIMHGRGDLKPLMHNELDILNQLRHRKLISLHDSYEYEDQLSLILELAAGGELVRDYLIKRDYYTESDIARFIRQILQGLDYMHTNGFGHMGLDIGDLLLSHPGSDDLKLTDFSLSRRITLGRLAPLLFGQPEYVSPECANGEGVGLGHDMWSVGIITYILLSGMSPFRGANDMETLQKIQSGKWMFEETWWSKLSIECRDFISKLLVYEADGRMDVHAALRHPWLERCDRTWIDEYQISSKYLRDYYMLYKEWYEVANCRLWFRRKALECAFNHPSKMIYIPGERFTPPPGEPRERKPFTWEEKIPSRSPLNYEIGMFKSESHYQNGPDTYLLQLRDVDFPCRLREYMKVAASRGPGYSYILSDENGYDWRTPIIRERRRFTDIMDEEIDDERKSRINRYGNVDSTHTIRRLRHEVGTRLDTYAEAEAYIESKQDGRLPFFREKPQLAAMQEGREVKLSCLAVGEPKPSVQWFKNDAILAESSRICIETDDVGRSHLILSPALGFDLGMYKVVARNKVGQTIARTRIVYGTVPDAPDSPTAAQISSNEALLTWRQPRNDGHSPINCYSLQYKLADDAEWTEQARNIDHEFYYMRGLKEEESYVFRLAARNAMGWSDLGGGSGAVRTHPAGAGKVQMSRAMMHLQQITDAGAEPQMEHQVTLDYSVETTPIEWDSSNVKDHFSFVSELSRGKFSTVMKAIDTKTDNLVVVKAIDIPAVSLDLLEGEFAALRSLRHERIASLLAAYKSDDMATFVLEKLQGADVLTYLASRQEYTEQTVATIVTQVLDALQYLHWRGLCHLDLQPDNIVMCSMRSVQAKLVDLGCAHRVTKLGNNVPVVGHPDYICPEVLAEEPAFPQSDIWSIGVLTYVMLSGTLPFRGSDENETRQNILFVRYRFEHLYKEVSQEGVRFVMLLFKRHANKRPTAEECHENRWLLPTDHMIRKRERAVFLGSRLKEYSEEYHAEKSKTALTETSALAGKNVLRSQSVQEELQTAAS